MTHLSRLGDEHGEEGESQEGKGQGESEGQGKDEKGRKEEGQEENPEATGSSSGSAGLSDGRNAHVSAGRPHLVAARIPPYCRAKLRKQPGGIALAG